jgi:hybrid cluster-associated redox disulfide protein
MKLESGGTIIMADTKKITADMSIDEVLKLYPETADVFRKYFHGGCFACPAARMETLGDGAMVHGLDVDFIIGELNKSAEEPKAKAAAH